MENCITRVQLGVVANKSKADMYIFSIYRRTEILKFDKSTMITSLVDYARWIKIRDDNVYIDRIGEYIKKCKDAKIFDINDSIL